jgi:hypothetical protein
MSSSKKHVYKKAKMDSDGWIQKRQYNYEFSQVVHSTRASIMKKNGVNLDGLTDNDVDPDFPPVSHTKRVSLKMPGTHVKNPYLKKKPSSVVSPPKSRKIPNPYTRCTQYLESLATNKTVPSVATYKGKKQDDVPTLEEIKRTNQLFYSYDPRGYKTKPLPEGYCISCYCPNKYCAETVFGTMVMNDALTRVYAPNACYETDCKTEMKSVFEEAYSQAVLSKLRWNGFDLNGYEEVESCKEIEIPTCMRVSSFKRFWNQIKKNNFNEEIIACTSFVDYDEEAEVEEALKNGEFKG